MPTSVKREAVQLRPEVHQIVVDQAEQAGLSKSKLLSMLVEEALINRGYWSPSDQTRAAVSAIFGQPVSSQPRTPTPQRQIPEPEWNALNERRNQGADDDELMRTFAEFQKFKQMMQSQRT